MKANILPENARLSDFISLTCLANECKVKYGIIYYRVLREAIPTYVIEGQQRPLFISSKHASVLIDAL